MIGAPAQLAPLPAPAPPTLPRSWCRATVSCPPPAALAAIAGARSGRLRSWLDRGKPRLRAKAQGLNPEPGPPGPGPGTHLERGTGNLTWNPAPGTRTARSRSLPLPRLATECASRDDTHAVRGGALARRRCQQSKADVSGARGKARAPIAHHRRRADGRGHGLRVRGCRTSRRPSRGRPHWSRRIRPRSRPHPADAAGRVHRNGGAARPSRRAGRSGPTWRRAALESRGHGSPAKMRTGLTAADALTWAGRSMLKAARTRTGGPPRRGVRGHVADRSRAAAHRSGGRGRIRTRRRRDRRPCPPVPGFCAGRGRPSARRSSSARGR